MEDSDSRPLASKVFGPLILLAVALLTFTLLAGDSPSGALGYTAGKLVISAALALPLFLLFRYATRRGRLLGTVESWNLLCIAIGVIWIVQAALLALMPTLISSIRTTAVTESTKYQPSAPSAAASGGKLVCDTEEERKRFGAFADLVPRCRLEQPEEK